MGITIESTSIDLSHHLSNVARARGVSPLKGLQKYFNKPGLISLAGGLPNPSYFPFDSISAEVLLPDTYFASTQQGSSALSWIWKLFGIQDAKPRTASLEIPKYPAHPGDPSLSTALQYSTAGGMDLLIQILKKFTGTVYQPAFRDWSVLVHAGNTDAWSNVISTFCDPGEGILTDEFTYPTAMATMLPHNIRPIPLAMDNSGIRADALRKTLQEWDESRSGMRRPHVLYTVPVGQNPVGLTMSAPRKKEIYDICREFDIIIVEDDPYYFLQMGPYIPKWQRSSFGIQDANQYVANLVPSFIKFDFEGRVIRLDSFSETVAPGVRLGWYTCNPLFAERLERATETTTLGPCGFSQAYVTSLLLQWKHEGYVRWLQSLAIRYKSRRDFMLDCIGESFQLRRVTETRGLLEDYDVYHAYGLPSVLGAEEKVALSPWFSFVAPTAGMFLWLTVFFENHPLYTTLGQKTLEMRLWTATAEKGVLFAPGWMFDGNASGITDRNTGHVRLSFSYAEPENMRKAIRIFYEVLDGFYRFQE